MVKKEVILERGLEPNSFPNIPAVSPPASEKGGNPRKGIGTFPTTSCALSAALSSASEKGGNPRKGIGTPALMLAFELVLLFSEKGGNPRKGIGTSE